MDNNWKNDYNWKEAFLFGIKPNTVSVDGDESDVFIDDVVEVVAMDSGANDELDWLMLGKLKDGRYFFLAAGCDYTGWDCRAGGVCHVAHNINDLYQYAITGEAYNRLFPVIQNGG